jgi:iron complex outermembrane receptor protein
MKKILLPVLSLLFLSKNCFSQQQADDTIPVTVLSAVIVHGYELNRPLKEVAAPVSIIRREQLQQFGANSILPALNAEPGIRMEERSPGSYRLNIRGSSLRSPFGVRNVKIYLDNIPFTDPGGSSYLNQFSIFNFSSIEVLRGPGSSLYGAGTGGVMLISSMPDSINHLSASYSRGSFNSKNLNISAGFRRMGFSNYISYSHQSTNGFRMQTAMDRKVLNWQTRSSINEKQSISTYVLYGDLFYETPGGLTRSQYISNPKAARPAAGGFPSAAGAKAAIYQKTLWSGINYQYQINEHWENNSSVYGAFSIIRNPAIRNYERRTEPHFGGRTTFSYVKAFRLLRLKFIAGAEFQQGYFNTRVFKNNQGNPDSLQTDDEINNRQLAAFSQVELSFNKGWILTAGSSLNKTHIAITRLSNVPNFNFSGKFNNELAPRITLLKSINKKLSVYGIVSKGYSPPTVSELLPSTSVINTELQAEKGINYELGFRANFFGTRVNIDVNAFRFNLKDAITQRRDNSGADYFVNAGNTRQQGIETSIKYLITRNDYRFISGANIWISHTYNHFRYESFKQVNTDYSGNIIPGVAPHTFAAGIEVAVKHGFYLNASYFYSDRIALNDANAEFASSYNLPGFKTGYRISAGKHFQAEIFFSADNLFNQTYSLGNDINAAGNRFYNTAPGVNYQAGINIKLL